VLGAAAGGEGAGNGEEDDFLVGPFYYSVSVVRLEILKELMMPGEGDL
jgi:hypothetical protein